MVEMREAYGMALLRHAGPDPRVVVLDSDVSKSTMSCRFAKAYPERFFNVGVAESNMTAMAAGFASVGKISIVNTYGIFLSTLALSATRALVAYLDLNVKLFASSSGLSDSYDGPSHHSTEDLAIMRSIANMKVMVAADNAAIDWMVGATITMPGPIYVRVCRTAVPSVHSTSTKFEVGKGLVLRDGSDATIVACGVMVARALEAADILAGDGLRVRVVDMFTLKPLDGELLRRCSRETGCIVTAEEHSVIGGLGGAVAEELALSGLRVVMDFVGIQDTFTQTGPYDAILARYGLDAPNIAAKVRRAVSRKMGTSSKILAPRFSLASSEV